MQTNFGHTITNHKKTILFLIALLLFLVLVVRAWPTTWDDSGITLAFSRNLARYGDIVPTAQTNRVEGYSSFLWMLINSFFFKIGLDVNTVLFIAKSLATIFAVANITLFWKLIRENIMTPAYQVGALFLYAVNSYTVMSAVDGMETSLYALLVLLSYYLYKKRNSSSADLVRFCLASSLLILIRHEGAIFLIPFGLAILYEQRAKIFSEPCLYVWGAVFLAYHGWHYAYFGELLTNPMLAKRFWPYRPTFDNFASIATFYLTPLFDFLFRYISIFILLVSSYLYKIIVRRLGPKKELNNLIILIAISSLFIMCITGANWGAAARLSYPGLPFLFVLLISAFDQEELLTKVRTIQFAALLGLIFNIIIVIEANSTLLPDIITLAGVERRASTISAMQLVLNRPLITFAGVDMGGLLLYHGEGKKIIDLGLLCDKELAKSGYANLNQYVFEQEKPEIIEAHGQWLAPLHASAAFTSSYTPVMVLTDRNEQILYLRKDIVSELKTTHSMNYATAKSGFKDIDQPALEQLGSFLVLDIRDNNQP
jgi:hypothetical protein